jgi:hypothetical protein
MAKVRLAVDAFLGKSVPGRMPSLMVTKKVQDWALAVRPVMAKPVDAPAGVSNAKVQAESAGVDHA